MRRYINGCNILERQGGKKHNLQVYYPVNNTHLFILSPEPPQPRPFATHYCTCMCFVEIFVLI